MDEVEVVWNSKVGVEFGWMWCGVVWCGLDFSPIFRIRT